MKLDSHLPERPGLLHAMPVLDIFALLLLFFLMGPSFVLQSGVRVEAPPSRFQLERFEDALVVTLAAGAVDSPPTIYLGREQVTRDSLVARLEVLREEGLTTRAMVLLKSDERTPVRVEREIAEVILETGFRLALVGSRPDGAGMPPQPLEEE